MVALNPPSTALDTSLDSSLRCFHVLRVFLGGFYLLAGFFQSLINFCVVQVTSCLQHSYREFSADIVFDHKVSDEFSHPSRFCMFLCIRLREGQPCFQHWRNVDGRTARLVEERPKVLKRCIGGIAHTNSKTPNSTGLLRESRTAKLFQLSFVIKYWHPPKVWFMDKSNLSAVRDWAFLGFSLRTIVPHGSSISPLFFMMTRRQLSPLFRRNRKCHFHRKYRWT